jgi:pyruvate/2-oxoglutarate dehydrogenase complex dihydrolipoamide dehydrogenase (E3) component
MMAEPEDCDLVVLGSGEAGKYLAWTLASEGKRAAVIERKYLGGSCPNIACLPSKNVIHSAKVSSYFRHSEEFGIAKEGWKINMSAVRDRKRKMVDGLLEIHRGKVKASGAEIVMGNGRFVAPRTIEVTLPDGGTRALRGKTVIINTGSRARIDDTPGLRAARPLTHVEALELDHLPEHLIVRASLFRPPFERLLGGQIRAWDGSPGSSSVGGIGSATTAWPRLRGSLA